MTTLVLLSLGGAVIAAVVGTLWYAPASPMGRLHLRYLGFDKLTEAELQAKMAESKPMMPKLYAAQLFLSLLTAFAVVFIVATSMQNGVTFSMAVGFVMLNWLCFAVPAIGSNIIWSNCERGVAFPKFLSDIFCNLTTLLLVALMTSFFV